MISNAHDSLPPQTSLWKERIFELRDCSMWCFLRCSHQVSNDIYVRVCFKYTAQAIVMWSIFLVRLLRVRWLVLLRLQNMHDRYGTKPVKSMRWWFESRLSRSAVMLVKSQHIQFGTGCWLCNDVLMQLCILQIIVCKFSSRWCLTDCWTRALSCRKDHRALY